MILLFSYKNPPMVYFTIEGFFLALKQFCDVFVPVTSILGTLFNGTVFMLNRYLFIKSKSLNSLISTLFPAFLSSNAFKTSL